MPGPTPAVTLADTYTIIVHMHNVFDPTIKWRNTHVVQYPLAQVPTPADQFIADIAAFHGDNLTDNCAVDEIEVRPWSFGNVPFSQQGALFRHTVNIVGTKAAILAYNGHGNEEMGGEVCALVERISTGTGRKGHMFLRGLLEDLDVAAFAGGQWVYKANPNVTPAKFASIVENRISAYLGAAALPGLGMVRFSRLVTQVPDPIFYHMLSLSLSPVVSVAKRSHKSKK